MDGKEALIVGISGCSSSGKTTLARLLRDLFPNTFILHEDDFYKPDSEIPMNQGLLDWDCPESISIPNMEKALAHIRSAGSLPPSMKSIQDLQSVGKCPASDAKIAAMKAKVDAWLQPGKPGHDILASGNLKLCIFDGFLLYCKEMQAVMELIDIKMFLLVSKAKAKHRREARQGYVTIEGFWEDPPGYVDKIVWPNYVAAHEWLFEEGNVEGKLKKELLDQLGIKAQSENGPDFDFDETFEWVVDTLIAELENRHRQQA